MISLLAIPMQEKCWIGFTTLFFLEDSMILALETHISELSNDV